MNVFEDTISMMEVLPESDLLKIQNYTKRLYMLRTTDSPFQPLKEEDIMDDLQLSRRQIEAGKCKEMGKAIEEIRKKYGI